MTQLYTITWQSPHGKVVTAYQLTEAHTRVLIEDNQRYTPDWTYTVQPPLPDLRAMLDAANARIAALETVCREVIRTHFDEGPSLERQKSLLALLDTLSDSR
jgi:hypothetical protein